MNRGEMAQIQKEMRRLGERSYEEMVEAVAQDIADTVNCMQGGPVPWDDETPENQWAFRQQARAAIDAVHAFQRRQAQPALHEDGYPVEEMGS